MVNSLSKRSASTLKSLGERRSQQLEVRIDPANQENVGNSAKLSTKRSSLGDGTPKKRPGSKAHAQGVAKLERERKEREKERKHNAHL